MDEEAGEVTVAAGVPQRMLLEYLSEYKYGSQPEGWVLPAFSWFVDQTIGGAVATGTHGSSFQHGSLSSQVTSLRLLLANGTIVDVSPSTYPHLFDAAGVSVGRLGVITDLTLKIKPQQAVTRNLEEMDLETFAKQVQKAQEAYVKALQSGNVTAQKQALAPLDETQAFWHVIPNVVWRTDYDYKEKDDEDVQLNATLNETIGTIDLKEYPDTKFNTNNTRLPVFKQSDVESIPKEEDILINPENWGRLYLFTMRGVVTPGTFDASNSFVRMSELASENSGSLDPYNQYEVAVPMERAGDCLLQVNDLVYGKNLSFGFRPPVLIRFVSGEPFYLSPSNGGPVMYGESLSSYCVSLVKLDA